MLYITHATVCLYHFGAMYPLFVAAFAVAYNVNLPDRPVAYNPEPVATVSVNCNGFGLPNYTFPQTRLPDALLALNITDPDPNAFSCELNNGSMTWTIRRALLPVTEDMIEGAGSVFRTPGCDHKDNFYFCPPQPCLLLEMDYQNYLPSELQSLLGHTSCGAVFGRGGLSSQYSGNIPPDPVLNGEDDLFYPGSVRVRTNPNGQREQEMSPLNPLSAYSSIHPKYSDVLVPGYAPIDGLGAKLTATHDFARVGSTANGGTGLFCEGVTYLSNVIGASNCVLMSGYPEFKLSLELEKTETFDDVVNTCADNLIMNASYNGIVIVRKPKNLDHTTVSTINCFACDPCVATSFLDPSWLADDGPLAISLMRDRDLKIARNAKLAQNLPIVREGTEDDEDVFVCADGVSWTVPDTDDCTRPDAPYPYPNHLLSCGCYRYFDLKQKNVAVPLQQVPPSPQCCKWVARQINFEAGASATLQYSNAAARNAVGLLNQLILLGDASSTCPFVSPRLQDTATKDVFDALQNGCAFNGANGEPLTLVATSSGGWQANDANNVQQYAFDPLRSLFTPSSTSSGYNQLAPYDDTSEGFVGAMQQPVPDMLVDHADTAITYHFVIEADKAPQPFAEPTTARDLQRHGNNQVLNTRVFITTNYQATTAASKIPQVSPSQVSPHHTLLYLPDCDNAYYVFYTFNLSAVLITPGKGCGTGDPLAPLLVLDNAATSWIDVGLSFSRMLPLVLIGTDAILQPCCPWYDWNLREGCAADPICNLGGKQCTMTAADLNSLGDLFPDLQTKCQADVSTPALVDNAVIGARFAKLNQDLTKSSENVKIKYAQPMNVPIDRSNEPFLRTTINWNDRRRPRNDRNAKWGRVRKAFVMNPGDDPFDAIVIIVAESSDETFQMSYSDNDAENGMRTWTVFIPGFSTADPCQVLAELPTVQIHLEPMQPNANANTAPFNAVWNVTVDVISPCVQQVDTPCKEVATTITPATVQHSAASSAQNIKLSVSKDTEQEPLEIDPDLLADIYQFSMDCASGTRDCVASPFPVKYATAKTEWAQQYIAATNARYQNLPNHNEYASVQQDLMGSVSNGENGEYCRWQYYDVRQRSFADQPVNDQVWRYTDTNRSMIFYPFTLPCNRHCDGEVLADLNFDDNKPANPLDFMGPCSEDLANTMYDNVKEKFCKTGQEIKRFIERGSREHSGHDLCSLMHHHPLAFLISDKAHFYGPYNKDDALACIAGVQIAFELDDQGFRVPVFATSPQRDGDGNIKNEMYEYAIVDPAMLKAHPTLQPPNVEQLKTFYKQFRDLQITKKYSVYDEYRVVILQMIQSDEGIRASKLQDATRFATKVYLFQYAALENGKTAAPIPIGIGIRKNQSDSPEALWTLLAGNDQAFNNENEFLEQTDTDRGRRAFDPMKNARFACQCNADSERPQQYDRSTAPPTALHEDSTQQFNNAPMFYKRCCAWSHAQNDFEPTRRDPDITFKKLQDIPEIHTPADAWNYLDSSERLWLSPYYRDRSAPAVNDGSSATPNMQMDDGVEFLPEGWTETDLNNGGAAVHRWVTHFNQYGTDSGNAQCGTLTNEGTRAKFTADATTKSRLLMASPRGPSTSPMHPQQFAITQVNIQTCASKEDMPPMLAPQRVATTNPNVPSDYDKRAYVADIPNKPIPAACDCNDAKPVYACQIYSEVTAFELLGTGPFDLRPFADADPTVCGWSWDKVPNGGINIGLFMGSYKADIFVMERDPLGDPNSATADAIRFFMGNGAPRQEDLEELIKNVGGENDFDLSHRKSGEEMTGYTSPNGKVTIFRAKGTCMRAPYGRVHRNELEVPSEHFLTKESNNGGLSPEADEAMYTYCEQHNGQFVYCDHDGMPYAERVAWCDRYPDNNVITLGYTIGLRNKDGKSPDTVCRLPTGNATDVLCLYIPNDPVNPQMANLIDIAAQMLPGAPITILVAPFNYTALFNLQTRVRFTVAGKGTSVFQQLSANTWPAQPSQQAKTHGHHIDEGSMAAIKNITNTSGIDQVVSALNSISVFFNGLTSTGKCPEGQQAGPVNIGGVQTDDYACYTIDTLVPHIAERHISVVVPQVTVRGPDPEGDILVLPPTVPGGATQCSVFVVSQPEFRVEGTLRVDNSGCSGEDVHQRVPLRFYGADVHGATVRLERLGTGLIPTAVTMLGYNPLSGVLSRNLLDVTGVQITVAGWQSFELGFAGAFARVAGSNETAVIECDAPCKAMVQRASEDDPFNVRLGDNVTKFDVTDVIDQFANAEQRAVKRSNQRQQSLSVVWFSIALVVATVALLDWLAAMSPLSKPTLSSPQTDSPFLSTAPKSYTSPAQLVAETRFQ